MSRVIQLDRLLASLDSLSGHIEVRRVELKRQLCALVDAKLDQAQLNVKNLTKCVRNQRARAIKQLIVVHPLNNKNNKKKPQVENVPQEKSVNVSSPSTTNGKGNRAALPQNSSSITRKPLRGTTRGGPVQTSIKPYSCAWPLCDYSAEQSHNVFKHIRTHHFKLPRAHKEQTKRNIVDDRDASEYIRVDEALKAELKKHSRYRCKAPDCGKRFLPRNSSISSATRKRSKRRCHGDVPNSVSTNIKPYSCVWPRCDYSAELRGSIFAHVRARHFKLPRFLKEQAKRNIVDDRDANEYIRVDEKLKARLKKHSRYRCKAPDCGKTFMSSINLTSHERIHMAIKPYSCTWPDCNYCAENFSNVFTHIRTQHFKLPRTVKEQIELNIVDDRIAQEYIRVDKKLARRRL